MTPSFAQQAVDALEAADLALNRDGDWSRHEREMLALIAIGRAQALASLAVAEALEDFRRHGLPIENVNR